MIHFERVCERDVDFLIMRSFASMPDFSNLFFDALGLHSAETISISHSVYDQDGESDIVIIVQCGDLHHALLIENKIDAEAQPEQYHRYLLRGERGKTLGEFDHFSVFLIAPQLYLSTNPEAQKYPYQIPYEAMLDFFTTKGAEFECQMLRDAIQKKEGGYTVVEVKPITDFWEDLYKYIQSNNFSVEMNKPSGAKGSRSTWIPFHTPLLGTCLYFKSNCKKLYGFVDLEFSGKLAENDRLCSDLDNYLEEGMRWEITGNSISLRLLVKPIDLTTPFQDNLQKIDEMLHAVERMTSFAIKLNNRGYIV